LWAWLDLNLRLHPDPKIHGEQARGIVREKPDPIGVALVVGEGRSGGGFEGDPISEGLELADVVALGAFRTDAGVVEAGAQVLEPCGRVG
jgi:hypothetical protein